MNEKLVCLQVTGRNVLFFAVLLCLVVREKGKRKSGKKEENSRKMMKLLQLTPVTSTCVSPNHSPTSKPISIGQLLTKTHGSKEKKKALIPPPELIQNPRRHYICNMV